MLKTLKNELAKDKKTSSNLKTDKPKPAQLIKKPMIYYKVDEQKVREKIENEFSLKKLFILKKKYFQKLKFYTQSRALRRKQRRRIISFFFYSLKKAFSILKHKHLSIIRYFRNLHKLKYIYAWAKQTKLISNCKNVFGTFISLRVLQALNKMKAKKDNKKITWKKKKLFFSKLFNTKLNFTIAKCSKRKVLRANLNDRQQMFYYKRFFRIVLVQSFYFQNLFFKFRYYFISCFIKKVKKANTQKKLTSQVVKANKLRIFFSLFRESSRKFREMKLKLRVIKSFHKDFIKLMFFHYLKRSTSRISILRELMLRFYVAFKKQSKLAFIESYFESREYIFFNEGRRK